MRTVAYECMEMAHPPGRAPAYLLTPYCHRCDYGWSQFFTQGSAGDPGSCPWHQSTRCSPPPLPQTGRLRTPHHGRARKPQRPSSSRYPVARTRCQRRPARRGHNRRPEQHRRVDAAKHTSGTGGVATSDRISRGEHGRRSRATDPLRHRGALESDDETPDAAG